MSFDFNMCLTGRAANVSPGLINRTTHISVENLNKNKCLEIPFKVDKMSSLLFLFRFYSSTVSFDFWPEIFGGIDFLFLVKHGVDYERWSSEGEEKAYF